MKRALVNAQLIAANPNAPDTAICPHCQRPVILRHRGATWYWRHQPGAPTSCPARFRPGRKKSTHQPPADRYPLHTDVKPASDDRHLAPIPANHLHKLITASHEYGANVVVLPDTPITFTVTGPGIVILATATQSADEESL